MKNVEQVLREMGACYQDYRPSGNSAVPEEMLKRWHKTLSEALLKADAVDETPFITRLRNEVMTQSKQTHNFTFSRDEVIELLGGKFDMLEKSANARKSTVENTEESAQKATNVQIHVDGMTEAEDAALFRALISHASEFKTFFDTKNQPTAVKAVFKITTSTSDSMAQKIRVLVKDFKENADATSEAIKK